ncbi:uncharacterized protein [Panulirus ornatus]|uniref:uncharacterized protein isoform X2 n=1 Tax=Panulirus ornatus TaxID=150431 RepID=UPI003A867E79
MNHSSSSDTRSSFGVRMCCGRVGGVVGVVGAVLVLLGVTQLIAGIYFMLVLPIFQLGSNIWTGIWSGMCGIIVGVIGWRKQAMQRGQMVLMATLSVLMADVANLVILQVGENGLFLSEDDLRIIIESNQDTILIIAFWLTTVLTSLGIVVSFLGAQYLFCVVVRGPKVKGRIPVTRTLSEEGLHLRQESQDSTPSLEDVVALPDPGGSSAWVYHPEEDKNATLLRSVGSNLLTDYPISSRRVPARHASFATSRFARVYQRPQRAQSFAARRDLQVSGSLPRKPPPIICPEPSSSKQNACRIHRSYSVIGRMMLEDSHEGSTLSRKFHACSLDELDAAPVIKVGFLSREKSRSDQSLSTFRETSSDGSGTIHIHRSTSVQERLLDGRTVLTSFGPINHSMPRIVKPKGPAPPPPKKRKSVPSSSDQSALSKFQDEEKEICDALTAFTTRSTEEEEQRTDNILLNINNGPIDNLQPHIGIQRESRSAVSNTKRILTFEHHLPLPVIEETIKNTRKRPAPQPHSALLSQSDDEASKETSAARQSGSLKSARTEVVKTSRSSLPEKSPSLVDQTSATTHPCRVKKTDRIQPEGMTVDNLRRLEEVLTNILDHGDTVSLRATKSDENITESLKTLDTKIPKSILRKSLIKPSKYEVAHREALEDSRVLLDQLPLSELQRNKIVLRVPSFRTAGCQTESYRPIRRRASCAQTNLSVAPRYKETATTTSSSTKTSSRVLPKEQWTNPELRDSPKEAAVVESSSSGYSSPEVSSKNPTPTHSDPPSPDSSSVVASDEDERRHETNVTVIEVNKSETESPRLPLWQDLDPKPPPRPPKPLRLRCKSDAAAFTNSHGGLLVPAPQRVSQLPFYEDQIGLTALTENVMLLTEAINPVLVHSTRPSEERSSSLSTTPRVVDVIRKTIHQSVQEDRSWEGRTVLVPRPHPAIRAHSLSLPRPSPNPIPRPRQIRGSRSPSPSRIKDHSHQKDKDEGSSTAAYLASLELLASHYRHQAIANAKQLQLQKRLLLQQQLKQQQQKQQQSQLREEDKEEGRQPQAPSSLVSPVKEESDC